MCAMQPSEEGGVEVWRSQASSLRQSVTLHSVPALPEANSSSSSERDSLLNSELLSQELGTQTSRSSRVSLSAQDPATLSARSSFLSAKGLLPDESLAKPAPRQSIPPASRVGVSSEDVRVVAPPPPKMRSGTHLPMDACVKGPRCRRVVKHRCFQAMSLLCLAAALALPDLWVLADRPDNADLDVLLTLVFVFFAVEFALQVAASRKYPGSFFFWIDMLGTSSLLLDISYLPLFLAGEYFSKPVLLTARFAKVTTRACRLGRLMKLLRFLPSRAGEVEEEAEGVAKCMSRRLNHALSLRVTLLIIGMVVFTPLASIWTYPQEDWSLDSWMVILEAVGTRSPEQLDEQLLQFHRFYADMAYFPYRLVVHLVGSVERVWEPPDVATRGAPTRRWNSRRLATGRLECQFNVRAPNQREAAVNMAQMLVVVLIMALSSLILSKSISDVIRPLNRLLEHLYSESKVIIKSVRMMADTVESKGQADRGTKATKPSMAPFGRRDTTCSVAEAEAEVEMLHLEDVMDKLAIVARFILDTKDGKEQLALLPSEGRSHFAWLSEDDDEHPHLRRTKMPSVEVHLSVIQSIGLSLELIDSWDLNPLALDRSRNHAACVFFLSPHNHGMAVDPSRLQSFLGAVEGSYNDVPYHSWFHAVDVTHSVYRLLSLFHCRLYMSTTERYALLVSATAHDCGHPGLKNQFLVETSHELALRYNDASPLENMHCQRLFEILAVPRNNILSGLHQKQFREVRRVCLDAILHTDIGLHFQMIKELQVLYEMNSALQESYLFSAADPQAFLSDEITVFYARQESRQLLSRLLLHLGDLSNATKPFRICRIWAHRCLDEFFAQGDAELAAGLPVQSLHDRSKVDREYSQIGFIEFLMAPLAFAAVKVLPPYVPCVEQLLDNMRQWQAAWAASAGPPADERAAVEARLRRLEQRFVRGA